MKIFFIFSVIFFVLRTTSVSSTYFFCFLISRIHLKTAFRHYLPGQLATFIFSRTLNNRNHKGIHPFFSSALLNHSFIAKYFFLHSLYSYVTNHKTIKTNKRTYTLYYDVLRFKDFNLWILRSSWLYLLSNMKPCYFVHWSGMRRKAKKKQSSNLQTLKFITLKFVI